MLAENCHGPNRPGIHFFDNPVYRSEHLSDMDYGSKWPVNTAALFGETVSSAVVAKVFLESSGRQRSSPVIGPFRDATHLRDGRSSPVDMYASR